MNKRYSVIMSSSNSNVLSTLMRRTQTSPHNKQPPALTNAASDDDDSDADAGTDVESFNRESLKHVVTKGNKKQVAVAPQPIQSKLTDKAVNKKQVQDMQNYGDDSDNENGIGAYHDDLEMHDGDDKGGDEDEEDEDEGDDDAALMPSNKPKGKPAQQQVSKPTQRQSNLSISFSKGGRASKIAEQTKRIKDNAPPASPNGVMTADEATAQMTSPVPSVKKGGGNKRKEVVAAEKKAAEAEEDEEDAEKDEEKPKPKRASRGKTLKDIPLATTWQELFKMVNDSNASADWKHVFYQSITHILLVTKERF